MTGRQRAAQLGLAHLVVLILICVVSAQIASEAGTVVGHSAGRTDATQLWLAWLLGAAVAALSLAQALAANTLLTGRTTGARLGLYPVRLVLASLGGAVPAVLLAALSFAVPVAPRPLLLAAFAALAAVSLVLCGAPRGVAPRWWRKPPT